MKLAKRMSLFAESATMAISGKVAEMKGQGIDIIGFSAGEPDFDVPEKAKDAAINAIREGKNKYTPVPGGPEIKESILSYVKDHYGLEYGPKEVIVSVGGKHSLFNVSQALYEEGDEVIIFSPYWVTYPDQVKLAGATPVFVDCPGSNDFNPDLDDLRSKVNKNTKAMIINSPCNPSGGLFTEEVIRGIAEIAEENDVILVTDDIYDRITYDGVKPLNIATISEELKKRTLLLNGFSKTFSMTGWRLGFALGPQEVIAAMTKLQGQCTSNPPAPLQIGAAEALKDMSFLDERIKAFQQRRDIIVESLNALEGVSCNVPKGAFYVFPDFSQWIGRSLEGEAIKDSVHLTELLIEKAHIAPVPGSAFGAEGHLRFSYAMDTGKMKEGLERLKEFSARLS